MEPENLALDRYILEQALKPDPTVCFLPTASGDSDRYIVNFYSAFSALPCRPRHLSLFNQPRDLAKVVSTCDVFMWAAETPETCSRSGVRPVSTFCSARRGKMGWCCAG